MNARALPVLLASLLAVVAAGGTVRAQQAEEPILVELQMGRLASRTVSAVRRGNDVLVPLSQFYELAEIKFSFPRSGVIEARLQPADLRLIVESDRDTISFGKRRIPLPEGALYSSEGEIYLSSALLGSLLNVRFVLDWSDLNVAVADPERLPLGRRVAREAARSSLAAMDGSVRPELALTLDRRHFNGLVFDYSLLSPMKDALGGSSFATALGAEILGGSLEMGLASTSTVDAGDLRADVSWTGVWRHRSKRRSRIRPRRTRRPIHETKMSPACRTADDEAPK